MSRNLGKKHAGLPRRGKGERNQHEASSSLYPSDPTALTLFPYFLARDSGGRHGLT